MSGGIKPMNTINKVALMLAITIPGGFITGILPYQLFKPTLILAGVLYVLNFWVAGSKRLFFLLSSVFFASTIVSRIMISYTLHYESNKDNPPGALALLVFGVSIFFLFGIMLGLLFQIFTKRRKA